MVVQAHPLIDFFVIFRNFFSTSVTKTAQFSTFSDFKECKLWSVPAKKNDTATLAFDENLYLKEID